MRNGRGFTLIELMVALAVALVVTGLVTVAVATQQRSYSTGHRERAAQTNGRAALLQLEQTAQIAGWGMDAPLALDFDRYTGPCPAAMGDCARDRVDGPDELVFMSRNPRYWVPQDRNQEPAGNAWRITGLNAGEVSVVAHGGEWFPAGQVLQAVCAGGSTWAYFTVGVTTGPGTAGADLPVPLTAPSERDPFQRQDLAGAGCFTNGTARLFRIDRYRYHVRPVLAEDTGWDPYLVLDTGTDVDRDGDVDEDDEIIVAEGIELLQVAYVLGEPSLPPRGLERGVPIAFTATPSNVGSQSANGITLLDFPGTPDPNNPLLLSGTGNEYLWSSWYGFAVGPPANARRTDDHQANVVALRIAISARGASQRPDRIPGLARGPLYNADAFPDWLGADEPWDRVTFESTIPLRNMAARVMNDW
jgi:type IV pilus assembly protein PilW